LKPRLRLLTSLTVPGVLDEAACLLGGARPSPSHSRAPSGSSGASWSQPYSHDSSAHFAHSRSGSRGGGLDAQGQYMEATVQRMLSAGRDRSVGCHQSRAAFRFTESH
jgi:hypothetical protein